MHPSHLTFAIALCLNLAACHMEFPQSAPIGPGHRAAPPARADVGDLRGMVVDQADPTQPLPVAFVRVGDRSTFTGAPDPQRVEEDVDDGRTITVMHTFPDGAGPVLTERRMRLYPADSLDRKYVYLRPGEFYLEGVPPGEATVKATLRYSETESQVTVVAGQTVEGILIALPTPDGEGSR